MNYTPLRKDDFDRSFKYKKQRFLCYSAKKLKELSPNKSYEIVGLARFTDKDTEHKLVLGNHLMAVFEPEKASLRYRDLGYIPVEGENRYIAVQESRAPLIATLGTMAIATSVICLTLRLAPTPQLRNIPIIRNLPIVSNLPQEDDEPQFNPLPPVDAFIEDYALTDGSPIEESNASKETPKGGGRVTISYQPQVNLNLTTGDVTMEYQNPRASSHDAVLSLYVVSGGKEYLIATSGRIPAGKQLKTMKLSAPKELFGGEGKYDAEYHVAYYDPVTGERALAAATINDIKLNVRK